MNYNENGGIFSQIDQDVLADLVITLEMSEGTTIIFAIAPEISPKHPVVDALKSALDLEEFQLENFFYSEDSLIRFLYSLDAVQQQAETENITLDEKRRVVMAFGIEQLPKPRIALELKRLNLGRDQLFQRDLVLIFWLNKRDFIEQFRYRAPDFWDWRGKVVTFQTRPQLDPLLYPYLESLIAENSHLKISGVMQVQRQVDIFLDQIYVSLEAEYQRQITEISDRGQYQVGSVTPRMSMTKSRGGEFAPQIDEFEPIVPDFIPTSLSTKTVT